MIFNPTQFETIFEPNLDGRAAPIVGALPASVVFSQRAAAILRAFMDQKGLDDYCIFQSSDFSFHDIDEHRTTLAGNVSWEALPSLVTGGESSATALDASAGRTQGVGALILSRHQVVIARWFWMETENYCALRQLTLCAAPTAEHCVGLRAELTKLRGINQRSYWQVVRGDSDCDGPRIARDPDAIDDLILATELRQRVETDILPFFTEPLANLYRALGVPHRRGLLLHGPPGNGKTSLIRMIGSRLPAVGAMLLRPHAGFDSDDLQIVIDRWKASAPAMLVIEDLNWLLKQVNISTFLNLIDGLDGQVAGGLLLIATTNYPDQLDWAINNRPGRFDVVIEIRSPDSALRREFFSRKLAGLPESAIESAVGRTDGLSFSHLQEILRVSGFRAIAAGRTERAAADLAEAVEVVMQGHEQAVRGFPRRSASIRTGSTGAADVSDLCVLYVVPGRTNEAVCYVKTTRDRWPDPGCSLGNSSYVRQCCGTYSYPQITATLLRDSFLRNLLISSNSLPKPESRPLRTCTLITPMFSD